MQLRVLDALSTAVWYCVWDPSSNAYQGAFCCWSFSISSSTKRVFEYYGDLFKMFHKQDIDIRNWDEYEGYSKERKKKGYHSLPVKIPSQYRKVRPLHSIFSRDRLWVLSVLLKNFVSVWFGKGYRRLFMPWSPRLWGAHNFGESFSLQNYYA